MDYKIREFRSWLAGHAELSSAYTVSSLRLLVTHMLIGGNFRSITEKHTKTKLFLYYLWIQEVVKEAKNTFGEDWPELLLKDLNSIRRKSPEQKYLQSWLSGLPIKTAINLDIDVADEDVFEDTRNSIGDLLNSIGLDVDRDQTWMLLMCGAATLTIRGSDKSKVGKQVERIFIRAALTILGFTLNENFWSNLARDKEVEREMDAEVETKRGRINIEVGLIMAGNQEVIEDKIGRVRQNGIIIFDKIGEKSNIRPTAEAHKVTLIQIREGNPLQDLHTVLSPIAKIRLNPVPADRYEIAERVAALPDEIFQF